MQLVENIKIEIRNFGVQYTDADLLSIKNDVSFLIDGRLSLYEHQSTYNPNLPLRFLLYIANQYASITKDVNLYGTRPHRDSDAGVYYFL